MDWFGKTIRWRHVGSEQHYLALQDGGAGVGPHWQSHQLRVKHLGTVVPDLAAVVRRLQAAGYTVNQPGASHPHRRSAYCQSDDVVQIEWVQYLSDLPGERNNCTR